MPLEGKVDDNFNPWGRECSLKFPSFSTIKSFSKIKWLFIPQAPPQNQPETLNPRQTNATQEINKNFNQWGRECTWSLIPSPLQNRRLILPRAPHKINPKPQNPRTTNATWEINKKFHHEMLSKFPPFSTIKLAMFSPSAPQDQPITLNPRKTNFNRREINSRLKQWKRNALKISILLHCKIDYSFSVNATRSTQNSKPWTLRRRISLEERITRVSSNEDVTHPKISIPLHCKILHQCHKINLKPWTPGRRMPPEEKSTRIPTTENVNGLKTLTLLGYGIVPNPLQHESRHPYFLSR